MKESIFDDLFVLELARNHWGSVSRGKEIIKQFAEVVHKNNVKASIKLQAFDTDNFIHKDFVLSAEEMADSEVSQAPGSHTRYIKKTMATKLTDEEFGQLVEAVRAEGLITMVTPYDERSVELCAELNVEIMKLASSDTGCLPLVKKVIATGKPLSISTGVVTLEHVDRVVDMAKEANIPLLVNQCVSNYPTDDADLHLNQIDFWKARYPSNPIGFSSHDYVDITRSHIAAVAKGAVSYERHVDIQADGRPVSKYCIIPEQAEEWFQSHHVVKAMCGGPNDSVREITDIEKGYIRSVNRGVYAKRDLPVGHTFSYEDLGTDFYLAIPLQEGQVSSSELNSPHTLTAEIKKDAPVRYDSIGA